MEKAVVKQESLIKYLSFAALSLLGCGLIVLCSLVKIPLFPVPFTLQTLAVLFLGLTQSPRLAFASVICYLFCASAGLPVLTGGNANSLWMVGKSCGYLFAFPVAAYLISVLAKKIHPMLASLAGVTLILALGFVCLIPFFGAQIAWTHGVVLFLPSEILKVFVAVGAAKLWSRRF